MNAHFVNRNPTPAEALTRVKELSWLLDSANSITAELAAHNLAEGKPAYWHTERYHNARSGIFLEEVNRRAGVEPAVAYLKPMFPTSGYGSETHLDWLLPLNDAAVMDLARAYRNVGSFREHSELIRRTDKAEAAARIAAVAETIDNPAPAVVEAHAKAMARIFERLAS